MAARALTLYLLRPVALPPGLSVELDVRLLGKGNSTSHGVGSIHLIIAIIQWIRTVEYSPYRRSGFRVWVCTRGVAARALTLFLLWPVALPPGLYADKTNILDSGIVTLE